jgi:nucleoside-diphosphate-sugar epimerase
MRIFLAGATGVIGRRVVPLLVGRGHSVTGLVRRPSDAEWLRGLGADAVVGNVFDRDGLRRSAGLAAPDVVMHQLTDLKGGNLGANSEMPLDLGASGSRRRTVQGVAALEAAVREAPEWVVLRYGVLYGPGKWYSRGGLMAQRASRGELAADGDVSSFVHVDDAAGAAVEALAWPSGFVNACDDVPAAGREWVPAFCRAVGWPSQWRLLAAGGTGGRGVPITGTRVSS